MQRFTSNPARFAVRARRYDPYTPPAPGAIPDLTLLTEAGDALTTQDGSYLLLELAVGAAIEGAILADSQRPIVTQASVYLRQD